MAVYTAAEILEQLDASARDYTFPMLDNGYYYPVEQRLHAFRADARWALVVEAVGYNPRGENVYDVLHVFGNCIEGEPGTANEDFLPRIDNWEEIEDDDE